MSVTIHEAELTIDDYEQEYDGSWRIFNGEYWKFAFGSKEKAIRYCKRLKGKAVGKAVFNGSYNDYHSVSFIGDDF